MCAPAPHPAGSEQTCLDHLYQRDRLSWRRHAKTSKHLLRPCLIHLESWEVSRCQRCCSLSLMHSCTPPITSCASPLRGRGSSNWVQRAGPVLPVLADHALRALLGEEAACGKSGQCLHRSLATKFEGTKRFCVRVLPASPRPVQVWLDPDGSLHGASLWLSMTPPQAHVPLCNCVVVDLGR